MAILHCYDSVVADAIPPAALVLGYVDGNWPTYDQLVTRFAAPQVTTRVLSVTVTGRPGAQIIDCEAGNAGPSASADWAKAELQAGRHPSVYASRDGILEVQAALRSLRVDQALVGWWLAYYVQVAPPEVEVRWPHYVPDGFIGWQFADSIPVAGGHSVDASVVRSAWARRHGWTGQGRGIHVRVGR